MSELSSSDYKKKLYLLIDHGTYDPDVLFVHLLNYHFKHDPDSDMFYDTQDDMEEIFDAMGSLLASNYSGQRHGSVDESEDAKRFRKVRNWIESVEYNNNNVLTRAGSNVNKLK